MTIAIKGKTIQMELLSRFYVYMFRGMKTTNNIGVVRLDYTIRLCHPCVMSNMNRGSTVDWKMSNEAFSRV